MTIREIVLWPKSYYRKHTGTGFNMENACNKFTASLSRENEANVEKRSRKTTKNKHMIYHTQHGRRCRHQKAPKMPIDIIISFRKRRLNQAEGNKREMVSKNEKL